MNITLENILLNDMAESRSLMHSLLMIVLALSMITLGVLGLVGRIEPEPSLFVLLFVTVSVLLASLARSVFILR